MALQETRIQVPESELTRTVGKIANKLVKLAELVQDRTVNAAEVREPDEQTIAIELVEILKGSPARPARRAVLGEGAHSYSAEDMANEVLERTMVGRRAIEERRQYLALLRQAVRNNLYRIVRPDQVQMPEEDGFKDPF